MEEKENRRKLETNHGRLNESLLSNERHMSTSELLNVGDNGDEVQIHICLSFNFTIKTMVKLIMFRNSYVRVCFKDTLK